MACASAPNTALASRRAEFSGDWWVALYGAWGHILTSQLCAST